ncbi:MAG: ArsC/Spx/MgsR family protein [Thermosynechococcaceae cyanobacterium]
MATVLFYEKPGCVNNTKQKALLQAAGHRVESRNLLTEAWTEQRLQPFLDRHPVVDWFNHSAPLIKSGAVIPEQLDGPSALQLLIEHPLLIRRPLLQSGDRHVIGFDIPEIDAWLGLTAIQETQHAFCEALKQQDLQTCPQANPTH